MRSAWAHEQVSEGRIRSVCELKIVMKEMERRGATLHLILLNRRIGIFRCL